MKKFKNEFKEFISRGNVVDLAVGVVVGGAFGKIVTSLVNDIIMPLIGTILGGLNFNALSFKINDAVIGYGAFIQNVVDFLIISFCIFVFIKFINRFKKKEEIKEEIKEEKEEEKRKEEVILLEEIRDLLKSKK